MRKKSVTYVSITDRKKFRQEDLNPCSHMATPLGIYGFQQQRGKLGVFVGFNKPPIQIKLSPLHRIIINAFGTIKNLLL